MGETVCLSVWGRHVSRDDAGATAEAKAAQRTQGCQEARGGLTTRHRCRAALRRQVDATVRQARQMTIAVDSFLTAEAFLWRESELRSSTLDKRDAFTSTNAQRHFNEGCVRRHDMRQSSRLFLSHHCSAGILKEHTFVIRTSTLICSSDATLC